MGSPSKSLFSKENELDVLFRKLKFPPSPPSRVSQDFSLFLFGTGRALGPKRRKAGRADFFIDGGTSASPDVTEAGLIFSLLGAAAASALFPVAQGGGGSSSGGSSRSSSSACGFGSLGHGKGAAQLWLQRSLGWERRPGLGLPRAIGGDARFLGRGALARAQVRRGRAPPPAAPFPPLSGLRFPSVWPPLCFSKLGSLAELLRERGRKAEVPVAFCVRAAVGNSERSGENT